MKTTKKELALLTAIYSGQYHDGRDPIDDEVWTWSACDSFGRSAGGIMASLVKKGLAGVAGTGDDGTCWITCEGFEALCAADPGLRHAAVERLLDEQAAIEHCNGEGIVSGDWWGSDDEIRHSQIGVELYDLGFKSSTAVG